MRTAANKPSGSGADIRFEFSLARMITGTADFELRDWTRGTRGYLEPAYPASGSGTRQEFSFKDLVQISLIKSLKNSRAAPSLIKAIMKLVGQDRTSDYLRVAPHLNFFSAMYDPSVLSGGQKISHEIRSSNLNDGRNFLHLVEIREPLLQKMESSKFSSRATSELIGEKIIDICESEPEGSPKTTHAGESRVKEMASILLKITNGLRGDRALSDFYEGETFRLTLKLSTINFSLKKKIMSL